VVLDRLHASAQSSSSLHDKAEVGLEVQLLSHLGPAPYMSAPLGWEYGPEIKYDVEGGRERKV
jgi:hypothetical protein